MTHCILISCVSLDVLYLELNKDKDVTDIVTSGRAPNEATKQLEGMLSVWINNKVLTIIIYNFAVSRKNYSTVNNLKFF